MQKLIVSAIKREKILLFILVSNCLNFAFFLSQLIIKGKSMRNMEAIPYTTKQRTSLLLDLN